MLYRSLTL